ncbi:Aldolase superfamily protein isoform 1 [Hibiscus syriacus]|uniref:Aldolase superfamily protein isoform 1 n=1 Tax=Hibiscus syriacus TaxID=106335 RepID=A0A6A2WE36_HIBSY|nr:Aldolase superfamily protein isoform 1 [Hibiscus syriacus]
MHDRRMGFSRNLNCFALLFLLLSFFLLQLEFSGSSHGSSLKKSAISASSQRFKPPVRGGGFEAGSHKAKDGGADDDDGIFDDEKRKVHTGPNPLHNR